MLVNFFKTKLKGLTYRIEILEECRRLKKAGRMLPKNYQSLIWSKPIVYDDFINFLCFLDNKTKVNLIDVGANIGEFSKNFHLFFPIKPSIICFEPLKFLIPKIEKNLSHLKDINLKIINSAIGNEKGKREIYFDKASTGLASLHKYNPDTMEFYNTEYKNKNLIDIEKLDDACKNFSEGENFIIKIDTQGHELEVLKGGIETIKRSSMLIVETSFVHEYKNINPSFSDCCSILKDCGLLPIIFQDYGKKISSYAFERDVIFVKDHLLKKIFYKNY